MSLIDYAFSKPLPMARTTWYLLKSSWEGFLDLYHHAHLWSSPEKFSLGIISAIYGIVGLGLLSIYCIGIYSGIAFTAAIMNEVTVVFLADLHPIYYTFLTPLIDAMLPFFITLCTALLCPRVNAEDELVDSGPTSPRGAAISFMRAYINFDDEDPQAYYQTPEGFANL